MQTKTIIDVVIILPFKKRCDANWYGYGDVEGVDSGFNALRIT